MKAYYDLHIHSVLSPCAERDMTPNNIVNMAMIKGQDFIAITDHNSIANVEAALSVASSLPITVIPGIEVQSKEDVHIVCLFKCLNDLKQFYDTIIAHITPLVHQTDKFGEQTIMNDNDEVIGCLEQSVYASIQLSVDDIIAKAQLLHGNAFPSHLERSSYSMISNLGFISPDLPIRAIEINIDTDADAFIAKHKYLKQYVLLRNSDAHELEKISEPLYSLDVKEKSIDAFFEALFGEES